MRMERQTSGQHGRTRPLHKRVRARGGRGTHRGRHRALFRRGVVRALLCLVLGRVEVDLGLGVRPHALVAAWARPVTLHRLGGKTEPRQGRGKNGTQKKCVNKRDGGKKRRRKKETKEKRDEGTKGKGTKEKGKAEKGDERKREGGKRGRPRKGRPRKGRPRKGRPIKGRDGTGFALAPTRGPAPPSVCPKPAPNLRPSPNPRPRPTQPAFLRTGHISG